jgi:hypothetical protein
MFFRDIEQAIAPVLHGKDFFAEDKESFRSIEMGERMEVAEGIKSAISSEAMDVRMPGEKIPKGLNRGNETGFKRIMGENGTKEFIDSFSSIACQ